MRRHRRYLSFMLEAETREIPREIRSPWAPIAAALLPDRSLRRSFWPVAIGAGYIALNAALGGLRSDHVFLACLPLLDLYNGTTRAFVRLFAPFILTGAIYDFMRYFYWQGIAGRVHVAGPYFRDLRWFGIPAGAGGARRWVTPNEYFAAHSSVLLDLACGFAYLVFVGEYLATAFFLFFRGMRGMLRRFGFCFLTVNLAGFITYFVYPAAPPWYVSLYGLGPARMHLEPHQAAAHRFDVLLGTHFFDSIYGRGVDVYGAYPSLHVSYPFLVTLVAFTLPALRWFRWPALGFYLLMCLSAVYLQHHYVVDIILGTLYAIATWLLVSRWMAREGTTAREGATA